MTSAEIIDHEISRSEFFLILFATRSFYRDSSSKTSLKLLATLRLKHEQAKGAMSPWSPNDYNCYTEGRVE